MAQPRFETLFREQLEALYNAEKQIAAALPKMIAIASTEELSSLLQSHLGETNEQAVRLEQIFEAMGEEPAVRESVGMKGLILECDGLMSRLDKGALLDVSLIWAAQKIEQYEICGYSSVQAIAEILGQQGFADLLEEAIEEEKAADENFWELAESIVERANGIEDEIPMEQEISEPYRR